MKPSGDRRVNARFEVCGTFWGAFGVDEPVRVVNITPRGALLDTPLPVPVESIQPVRLTVGDLVTTVEGRVRHAAPEPGGGAQPRYLIGLEFLSPSTPFLESVDHLVAAAKSHHDAD